MIRCTLCRRPLTDSASNIAARGGLVNVGPVCAKRAGLLPVLPARERAAPAGRKIARRAADARQMELLET